MFRSLKTLIAVWVLADVGGGRSKFSSCLGFCPWREALGPMHRCHRLRLVSGWPKLLILLYGRYVVGSEPGRSCGYFRSYHCSSALIIEWNWTSKTQNACTSKWGFVYLEQGYGYLDPNVWMYVYQELKRPRWKINLSCFCLCLCRLWCYVARSVCVTSKISRAAYWICRCYILACGEYFFKWKRGDLLLRGRMKCNKFKWKKRGCYVTRDEVSIWNTSRKEEVIDFFFLFSLVRNQFWIYFDDFVRVIYRPVYLLVYRWYDVRFVLLLREQTKTWEER